MIHRSTDIKAAMRSRQRGFLLNPHRFGSAPFSPLSLPGLAGWYDSSDSATRTLVSGKVSQWADKSGNARHATQATAGLRYTHSAASVNGLDSFTGARSAQMYIASALPSISAAGAYVFCVGGALGEVPFVVQTGAAAKPFALDLSASGTMYAWGDGAGSFVTMTGLGAATSDGSINAFGICSATSGTSSTACFNAGRSTGGALPGVIGIDGITNYTGGGDYTLNGSICELIIGTSHLTTGQINSVMDYLKEKWATP